MNLSIYNTTSPSTDDPYRSCYTLESDNVRIFQLLPASSRGSQICGTLLTSSLSEIQSGLGTHQYIALSYTWGDEFSQKAIILNRSMFMVRRNLYCALRDLRLRDQPQLLWIDAICINQQNVDERNHQVQQMRDIYSTATETVIYLGEEYGSSMERSAWEYLQSPLHLATSDTAASLAERPSDSATAALSNWKNLGVHDRIILLYSILRRAWFKRIWVFQEVVVSESLKVKCGQKEIKWDNFCERVLWRLPEDLSSKPEWLPLITIRDMFLARCLYRGIEPPSWSVGAKDGGEARLKLSYLLFRGIKFEATDPRDKFYALIGIASDVDDALKKKVVNYNQTEVEVYTNMTALAIDSDSSYTILSHAGFRFNQLRPHAHLKPAPSWAVDWAAEPSQATILQNLSQDTLETARHRESLVKEFHTWSEYRQQLLCAGSILGTLVTVSSGYPYSYEKISDAGVVPTRYLLGTIFESFKEAGQRIVVEFEDAQQLQIGDQLLCAIREERNRRLAVSRIPGVGYKFVIVPATAKRGDMIVSILGARVLFVASPYIDEHGTEKFLLRYTLGDFSSKICGTWVGQGRGTAEIMEEVYHLKLEGECCVDNIEMGGVTPPEVEESLKDSPAILIFY